MITMTIKIETDEYPGATTEKILEFDSVEEMVDYDLTEMDTGIDELKSEFIDNLNLEHEKKDVFSSREIYE